MSQWIDVCSTDDLQPDSGICALIDNKQVAIFYFPGTDEIYAVSNYDPFSKTHILSRGMVGDLNGEVMVASPMYKQHFSLKTGICFEDNSVKIETYAVRITNDRVEIRISE